MPAQVVRLRPQQGSTENARAHFLRARYLPCLSELHGHATTEAAILASRAYARLGRLPEAVSALDAAPPDVDASHELKGTYYTLLANWLRRCGDNERAEAALVEARVNAFSTRDVGVVAEYEYFEGRHAWSSRDLVSAQAHAVNATCPALPDHARTLQLQALIAASRGDYAAQVAFLRGGLEHIAAFDERDIFLEATLLEQLAGLMTDLYLPEEIRIVVARTASLEWTEAMKEQRYSIARCLGWCEAIGGNDLAAFRWLRDAAELAPSADLRVVATLDRCILAREMGQDLMAEDALDHAQRLADKVDWAKSAGDFRGGLLWLAEATAPRDPARARGYVARYKKIGKPMDPLLLARSDPRWTALEQFAFGTVAEHDGEKSRAVQHFLEALTIWKKAGYAWRAARAALRLHELTGERHYAAVARAQAAKFAASWLTRRVAQANAS